MRGQRLPDIDRPHAQDPQKIDDNQPKRPRFSYYKALSELKDVNHKVSVVKNRLNFLLFKQQQAQHPLATYFEEKQIRLRTNANQEQQRFKQQLSAKRLKSQSEVELKRRTNQLHRRQTLERIDYAKKIMSSQKIKVHEEIRERSRQNSRAIEDFRLSFLHEKQTRRQLLYGHEKKQRIFAKNFHEMKAQEIRSECEAETKRIFQKISERQEELKAIQEECQAIQETQQERIIRHRERKLQKLRQKRLITLDTSSASDYRTNYKTHHSPSTSPHSCVSFVVIS